jgi:hypothetical protein
MLVVSVSLWFQVSDFLNEKKQQFSNLKKSKMKWTLEEEQALMQILKGKSSPAVTYSEMG